MDNRTGRTFVKLQREARARAERPSKLLLVVAAVTMFQCAANAQGTPQASTRANAGESQSKDIKIGTGDVIDVIVFDTPELSAAKIRVSADGLVKLPIAGDVSVLNLTSSQAATVIEARLRDDHIMLDPHVTVSIADPATQGIKVLGQVRNPGTFTLYGPHTLYDALSAAGGTTPEEGATVEIVHPDDPQHPTIIPVDTKTYSELEQSTAISAGDVVLVSRAESIFILGDVGRPGEYLMEHGRHLKALEAVARASGTIETAALGSATILRKTENGTVRLPLNLRRVQTNKAADITLQAGDILIVPHSTVKQIMESVVPLAAGSIIGAAVSTAIK